MPQQQQHLCSRLIAGLHITPETVLCFIDMLEYSQKKMQAYPLAKHLMQLDTLSPLHHDTHRCIECAQNGGGRPLRINELLGSFHDIRDLVEDAWWEKGIRTNFRVTPPALHEIAWRFSHATR